jgi:hypothetical protein
MSSHDSLLLGLSHLLRLLVQHLLDSRASDQLLVPLVALWIAALPLVVESFVHQESSHGVPGDEHQVYIRHFVSNEVWLLGFG